MKLQPALPRPHLLFQFCLKEVSTNHRWLSTTLTTTPVAGEYLGLKPVATPAISHSLGGQVITLDSLGDAQQFGEVADRKGMIFFTKELEPLIELCFRVTRILGRHCTKLSSRISTNAVLLGKLCNQTMRCSRATLLQNQFSKAVVVLNLLDRTLNVPGSFGFRLSHGCYAFWSLFFELWTLQYFNSGIKAYWAFRRVVQK